MAEAGGSGPRDINQQAKAWAIALNLVYGVIGMGAIGLLLDYFFGTMPWLMLILGGLGLIGGMYRFIKDALALTREGSRPRQR